MYGGAFSFKNNDFSDLTFQNCGFSVVEVRRKCERNVNELSKLEGAGVGV